MVDYSYYRDSFGGTVISAEDFPVYAKRAEAYIRYLTAGRSNSVDLDVVKDAVCAVCDVFAADEAQMQADGGREKASENNDGYSVSYVTEGMDGQTHEEVLRQKAYQAVYPYLAFTGLLNRRVNHAYQCGHHHL